MVGSAAADLASNLQFYDLRSGDPVSVGPVTPETVAGFELLYATPGSGDISEIAGHLLLRIKLNGPHDLVVSFLADTEAGKAKDTNATVVIQEHCRGRNWLNLVQAPDPAGESALASIRQSLKGLAGGFAVTMDVQTLAHTLKTYTVEQDRTIWRFELVLTDDLKRSLLAHLERVQNQPGPPYYFFSQNCGSVLVQVLGEGLGDRYVATFHPWVSPPHSLVALLIRRGIARPVAPHFHSFRQLGYLYRARFAQCYQECAAAHPRLDWPPLPDFSSARESTRADAVYGLAGSGADAEDLDLLGSLIQEMAMAYDHKDRACRDYTSAATAAARAMQNELRRTAILPARDMQAELAQVPQYHALRKGTDHTGLFTFTPGVASLDGRFAGSFDGALLKQEIGSSSRMAMQRASALELGGVGVVADDEGNFEWRLTALKLAKCRDTLERVPSCFESLRGLGLELSVLDAEHRTLTGHSRVRWAGLGALANILSSENHDNFLNASLGLDFSQVQHPGFEFPVRLESLVTAGPLQWRNRAEYLATAIAGAADEVRAETGIALRLGAGAAAEYRLHLSSDYQRMLEENPRDRWLLKLGLEIQRW